MNTPQSNPWAEVKRLQAENRRLKIQFDAAVLRWQEATAQLAATEEALAQVQRESAKLRDEYRWLCGYPGFAAMAVCEAAVALAIAASAESKLTRMTLRDWRDQDAREIGIHDCHILMNAEESARVALDLAVAEYRAQVAGYDAAPERLKDLVRQRAFALSPAKQTVFEAALDRLSDEKTLEEMSNEH